MSYIKYDERNLEFDYFSGLFDDGLNKSVPIKRKYIRANQGRYATKELNNVIMTLFRVRIFFLPF